MKNLIRLSEAWMPVQREWKQSDLIIHRLGDLYNCVPEGRNQLWYGIYLISHSVLKQRSSQNTATLHPSLSLLNSNLEFVTSQIHCHEQGYVLLLSHDFLPEKVNRKLNALPLFLNRGGKTFDLNFEQVARLSDLFDKIASELSSTYEYKQELVSILLMQLAHFIIRNFMPSKSIEPLHDDHLTNSRCKTLG